MRLSPYTLPQAYLPLGKGLSLFSRFPGNSSDPSLILPWGPTPGESLCSGYVTDHVTAQDAFFLPLFHCCHAAEKSLVLNNPGPLEAQGFTRSLTAKLLVCDMCV